MQNAEAFFLSSNRSCMISRRSPVMIMDINASLISLGQAALCVWKLMGAGWSSAAQLDFHPSSECCFPRYLILQLISYLTLLRKFRCVVHYRRPQIQYHIFSTTSIALHRAVEAGCRQKFQLRALCGFSNALVFQQIKLSSN